MTALLTLAERLGIDPGPLNQADLQEQVCSKALAQIEMLTRERDEALAAYEHVCNVALQCTAIVESADGCLGADLIEACNIGLHKPAMAKLLAAMKAEWNCPTIESGTNRYGLDVAYFRNLFNRELSRTLQDYRPDELARNLLRMARTADKSIIAEDEFSGWLKAEWQNEAINEIGNAFKEAWPDHTGKYYFIVGHRVRQSAQEAGE